MVRSFAKKVGKSQELAFELWDTKYHEARMLAVLLMNPKITTEAVAERLLSDVMSWDLCDHLCKNLFLKMECRMQEPQLYKKRAAFVLIAASVIHDKKLENDMVDGYLELIMRYADDEREHVKKAASSALKEIGKKDFHYNEKALLLAHEWTERGNKAQRWIGKDALRELETMVKAEGRGRLISANTRMGKETY
uniref:DNA alkylation repair protein n=1 Tax=Enterocloster clostridioformis TaxID=1531 RepID=UPI0026EB19D6|nr:DNA alkylation repair protein [Enterocloster clostridioformis]